MASLSSFWEHYEGDEEWSCDVHARASGDRIAAFKPPGVDAHSIASLAFLTENRVAMATSSSFKVLKLPMGQLQGSHTPALAPVVEVQRAVGLVTVNAPATQLTFLPGGCSSVFLYDAHTMAPLGAIHLEGYVLPEERVWHILGCVHLLTALLKT